MESLINALNMVRGGLDTISVVGFANMKQMCQCVGALDNIIKQLEDAAHKAEEKEE